MCGHSIDLTSPKWIKERPTERGYYVYASFFSCGCTVFGGFLDVFEGCLGGDDEEYCLIYYERVRDGDARSGKVKDLPDYAYYMKINVPKEVYDD